MLSDSLAAWSYLSEDYSARLCEGHGGAYSSCGKTVAMRNKIKEYRAKHSLTQEKLAEMVGVRRETIIFLEQGKYNPSLKLAHNVAKALKTTIDEIFIFDD